MITAALMTNAATLSPAKPAVKVDFRQPQQQGGKQRPAEEHRQKERAGGVAIVPCWHGIDLVNPGHCEDKQQP